jgi:hypothetical protein
MRYTRTHLAVDPDWQSPGATGFWEIGYYVNGQRDVLMILAQGLEPGPEWFVNLYSRDRCQLLPGETRALVQDLGTTHPDLISTCTIPNAHGKPVEYFTVADDRIEELLSAAKVWYEVIP